MVLVMGRFWGDSGRLEEGERNGKEKGKVSGLGKDEGGFGVLVCEGK